MKPRHIILTVAGLLATASLAIAGFFIFQNTHKVAPPPEASLPEPNLAEPPYHFDYS